MEKLIFGSFFLNYFATVQALNYFGFKTAAIIVFAAPFVFLLAETVYSNMKPFTK